MKKEKLTRLERYLRHRLGIRHMDRLGSLWPFLLSTMLPLTAFRWPLQRSRIVIKQAGNNTTFRNYLASWDLSLTDKTDLLKIYPTGRFFRPPASTAENLWKKIDRTLPSFPKIFERTTRPKTCGKLGYRIPVVLSSFENEQESGAKFDESERDRLCKGPCFDNLPWAI